ncbi:MAG: sigma-70 family RNA polymerase sigma factor [Gammaproteobacteria bacterium]|nr:sigma-70 family RNA polymerase sigma factor [Gammaproteobacteria bacterium]
MQPGDEELVARAIATRDAQAYGELVRRYQSRVRGWLRQLARNDAVADDLAQETFLRAWNKLGSYSGKGKFSAWLMKIAYTQFLQAARRSKRERQSSERYSAELAINAATTLDGFDGEFTDASRFLSILSDDERQAIVLVHGYGFSHGDASNVTGMPIGTVKSHVRRGTEKIRQRFELTKAGA